MGELTARQEEYLDALPQPSYQAWADAVGASESSAEEMRRRLNDENDEIAIEKVDGEWLNTFGDADDPEREDLNERETYIYRSLPKSAAALADDLGIGEIVVDAHLQSIADKGWPADLRYELAKTGRGVRRADRRQGPERLPRRRDRPRRQR